MAVKQRKIREIRPGVYTDDEVPSIFLKGENMAKSKKVVKDNVPYAVHKKDCKCGKVSCSDVAKCLAKLTGMALVGAALLGLAFGLEYMIYNAGSEAGFDKGVISALDDKSPCTEREAAARWYGSAGHEYYCEFSSKEKKYVWMTKAQEHDDWP